MLKIKRLIMRKRTTLFLASLLYFFIYSTQANIEVVFTESAPKDQFSIKNVGDCTLNNLSLAIDLASSQGKLLFDTLGTGAGEDVFQPFEITQGQSLMALAKAVNDGDTRLSLIISSLSAQQTVSFTIDVDDTLTNSELRRTRVTGSEIQNGLVTVRSDQLAELGIFDNRNKATVLLPPCPV